MADHGELVVDFDAGATDHPIMTLIVTTRQGVVTIMAEVAERGSVLELTGLHIHSSSGPNAFGAARLRELAHALMEMFNVDAVVVEGARRTTGAVPGNRKGPFRFTRKASSRRRKEP
jgi:hypothetical protein